MNKWNAIVFVLFSCFVYAFDLQGQKNDTTYVKQLLDSALKMEFSDNTLSQKIANQALSLAEKNGFLKYNSKALVILGYLSDDIGNFSEAKKYYERSLEINIKTGNKKSIGSDYNNLGLNAENVGNLSDAIYFQTKSLLIREEIKDTFGIAASNNNIGNIYGRQGDYAKALHYFLKSLKIVEQSKNENRLPPQLNNVAIIYNRLKNYDKAIEYYSKALELWKKNNNTEGIAIVNYNISNVYKNYKKYDKALMYADEALRCNKEIGNKSGVAECHNLIGSIYSILKIYDKALSHFEIALKIKLELNDKSELVTIYENLASVYFELGNSDKALSYLDKSTPLALNNRLLIDLKEIYKLYYRIYKSTNNYNLSLKYHELYFSVNDSVYNTESAKQLNELNTRYETDKKEKENKLLQLDNVVKNKEIEKHKTTRNFLIGIIGLFIFIIIGSYIAYRKIKSFSLLLAVQKHSIEQKNHLLEEQKKEITDSINYAQRIQYALLAHRDMLNHNLQEYFVLFNPKDIVSGDFYWATEHDNKFYLAVCDSTGHGVPGAFMSLLNIGFLNEAIKEKHITEPHLILNYVRDRLIESIGNEGQKDGMDAILVCFNKDSSDKQVTYAAANNEPILIRENQIIELPKDKMPVGKGEKTDSFTLQHINFQKGDVLYLYTDGYADQFGGPKGKKFKYKPLNELLLFMSNNSVNEQKNLLTQTFFDWKGSLEQVDDVCIIGIKN